MIEEKIKTALDILNDNLTYGKDTYLAGQEDNIIKAMEEYASQFKQPPVSVMPSYGEILEKFLSEMRDCPFHIKHNEQVYELGDIVKTLKKCLSLPKEANKERIPDVGETIKETAIDRSTIRDIIRKNSGYEYVTGHGILANDVHIHGLTEDIFDLFKQRNK